jgi:long-chain acyl-CoA synthetase
MSVKLDLCSSIPATFFKLAEQHGQRILYSQAQIPAGGDRPDRKRELRSRTYAEVRERVERIAGYLRSLGMSPGSRAAILSSTRPEWIEADLAVLSLGGVVVPIYHSLPLETVGYILRDSGAEVVFAENQEQAARVCELAAGARPAIKKVITFENVPAHAIVTGLEQILANGERAQDRGLAEIGWDSTASLVYTSGTTGLPKGVIHTHGNYLSNLQQMWQPDLFRDGDCLMLCLPLAHSFARLMGYLGFLTPAALRFPAVASRDSSAFNAASVARDMRELQATILPVVPRILEKLQASIVDRSKKGSAAGRLLRLALWSARRVAEAKRSGETPSLLARIGYEGTAVIRGKIKENLFGPRFECAVCGGARLNIETARFFESLGIEVLEGYGLTETCVAICVNRRGARKEGSVGPALADDIQLRLAEDGEVLVKGPNVAKGYYGREEATKEAWDAQGWFHTGDLGALDGDGYLSIIGRKKNFILTSYGKHVCAEGVEQKLISSEYIAQAVLAGEGRPYCVALVIPDRGAVDAWARRRGVKNAGPLEQDTRVHELIWGEVERINRELPSWERVKKIAVVSAEFTVENGLLTPTFKVRKAAVLDRFKEQVERLYRE